MATRTAYVTIPDGGGGYTVTLATFDFDELDYMPEAIGSANYPTSYGVVNGAFYLISGTIYFVPDEPFPLAPAETASTSDVDLRIYGTSASQTISAPDGDGYVILSGPDASGVGTGSDTIYAGTGDDHIYVGDGNDTVHGGDGDDIIGGWNHGGSGTNLLDGQAGDDQIVGGSGNDTIIGGTGDDFLSGGAGSDTLSGGEGSDTFWIEGNDDQVVVVGGETGSDVDHILFANDTSISPVVVRFTGDEQGTYSYLLTGAYGSFSEIEAITGTDHADQINASQSTVAQSLAGGGGHDYLQGGMSSDTIYGGSGNDTIIGEGYAATGANLIVNGSFEDTTGMIATVYGYMGAGTVPGWTEANGYDIDFHSDSRNGIVAQDGAHWLDMEGYAGQNLRIGQNVAGIQDGETYIIHVDVADFLSVQDNTSDDNQVQIIWNGVVVATINPPDGSWETFEFVVVGGSGDATNRLEFAGAGFADAMGVSFDNVEMHLAVPTSDADDRLIGGTGDDTIAGGDGGDLIQGNEGTNTLAGGGGDDVFEVVTAQAGTDTIRGGEATEMLGDTLRFVGTDAATIVFATLESGSYTAGTASGSFADIERFEGTGAHDVLDFRALGPPLTIMLDGNGAGTVTDGTATIHFSNIDEILATDEDDIIDASADAGGMTLHGRGGDDQITGGAGSDELMGGDGDDVIASGNGNDTLWGDAGSDTFVVDETDTGADLVYGGESLNDSDTLQFTGSAGAFVTFAVWEGGTYSYAGATGDFWEIERVLGSDGDDVIDAGADGSGLEINGGAGNDTITGGTGDDSLTGGSGDDRFVVGEAMGNDTITGGETGETAGDTLDASLRTTGLNVVLTGDGAGTASGGGDSLTFAELENFILTDAADSLDASGDTSGVTVDAAAGDDILTSGAGNDSLSGGAGADVFRVDQGDGTDTLDGGADFDRLEMSDTSGGGADVIWTGADTGTWSYNATSAEGDFASIERVDGTESADSFDASGATDSTDIRGRGGDDLIIGSEDNDRLEGGTGDDTITGGGGDDIFVYSASDGTDTITDFNAGNTGPNNDGNSSNNDFINLSAFYDTVWELRADQADDGILNQSNDGVDGVDYSDNTAFGTGSLTFTGATSDGSFFTAENTGVACFVKGTLILTPRGERRIEDLQPGDLVLTADNGPKAIGWIGRQRLGRKRLAADPHLKPIRIAPSLLGSDRSLVVSPQHGILLQEGRDETLVRARHLARIHGTQARVLEHCEGVTYFHLLFDGHEIIFANGARSESFYPGEQSIGALSQEARAEIAAIFPAIAAQGPSSWDHARDWLGREGLPDDLRALLPG